MPRGTSEVSEPMYFVLTALRAGPLHGHAISKAIRELSRGGSSRPWARSTASWSA
ncbi:hypothetical protein ACFQ0B_13640 [Nonomuraea thailandensis]